MCGQSIETMLSQDWTGYFDGGDYHIYCVLFSDVDRFQGLFRIWFYCGHGYCHVAGLDDDCIARCAGAGGSKVHVDSHAACVGTQLGRCPGAFPISQSW